ncbi:MAG: Xaa-Pro peptidase family protein [archaeon]
MQKTNFLSNFNGLNNNFYYFTGLKGVISNSIALIEGKKKTVIVSNLDYDNALRQAKKLKLKVRKFSSKKELEELIKKELKGKVVGLNYARTSIKELKWLEKVLKKKNFKNFKDIEQEIGLKRSIKSREEIRKLRKVCLLTRTIFMKLTEEIKLNMTEKQIKAILDKMVFEKHASYSFPPIIAAGKNSLTPHHQPSNKKLLKNELLLIDFGLKLEGYCSDITRVLVAGKASKKQRKLFEKVLKALKETMKKVKAGVNGLELQETAEKVLENKIPHSIGHGIGLNVHDYPKKLKSRKTILKKGMIITIEPGLYIKGVGGVRIEDDVLVTINGSKVLTKIPRKLFEIKS